MFSDISWSFFFWWQHLLRAPAYDGVNFTALSEPRKQASWLLVFEELSIQILLCITHCNDYGTYLRQRWRATEALLPVRRPVLNLAVSLYHLARVTLSGYFLALLYPGHLA